MTWSNEEILWNIADIQQDQGICKTPFYAPSIKSC
jgi:hypothetical protein